MQQKISFLTKFGERKTKTMQDVGKYPRHGRLGSMSFMVVLWSGVTTEFGGCN